MSILNYIEKIKSENEGSRITAQEPRNMYAGGQLVRNTADGSRPGYSGDYTAAEKKKQNRIPTKPEMIIEILNNNKDGKFILFSQYDASFENITKILSEMKITFTELKGHSSTISKKIKEFNDGKIKILYLNSNYNGAGINLQIATDIILYHEMSNDLTTQIIGRANRIGREKELYVHHLV